MDAKVAVVGGGSAGLMTAVAAGRAGAVVTVLERLPRVGKKLLATGNGRCNLTNLDPDPSRYHGRHPSFPREALGRFPAAAAMAFFEELGIAPVVEEGGKIFPRSGQASAVLDVLRREAERLGVRTLTEAEVHRIRPAAGGFRLEYGRGAELTAGRVVLASGGRAAPHLGSNGSGYNLATALGHRLVPVYPALTKLLCEAPFLKRLKGMKVDGTASLSDGRSILRTEPGEILFTEAGVSGPPVLQISRLAGELLQEGQPVWVVLNLAAEMTPEALEDLLVRRCRAQGDKDLEFGLVGFLNKRLIPVVLTAAGFADHARPCSSLTADEVRRLAALLAAWSIPVGGLASWTEAQVTAGGIDTAQVDAATMESRLVPGLHLAGEVLDVDGDCGGFNLQWAWASGHLAGHHAAAG